jgi:hypothetical protein
VIGAKTFRWYRNERGKWVRDSPERDLKITNRKLYINE